MNKEDGNMSHEVEGIPHLDSKELQDILSDQANRTILIDVREPEEYDAGHIGTIPLIPMGEIADYIERFDRSREYVFVCRSGRRSLEVAKFFRNSGFERVHNFAGGMLGWDGEVVYGPENVLTEFNAEQLERKRD
jgi:rhodanese-related sulfurtransferase